MKEAAPDEVAAALARAGRVNALLTFAGGSPAALPAVRFDAAAAGELVDRVGAWLGVRERRVAASLVVLGYAARLVGPPVAVLLCDRLLVDARPAAVRFAFDRGFQLSVTGAGWRGPYDELVDRWRRDVLDDHLAAVVASVRKDTPVAAGLLWGNVASGLLGALAALVRAGAVPAERCASFAEGVLATGPLAGAGHVRLTGGRLTFRRRSCCLYYRLPGGGYCGDCCLTEDA